MKSISFTSAAWTVLQLILQLRYLIGGGRGHEDKQARENLLMFYGTIAVFRNCSRNVTYVSAHTVNNTFCFDGWLQARVGFTPIVAHEQHN